MLALSFTFPGGRYHATPWDRHVNEGAVAWPPEPWRILRALISTWHHKIKHTGPHETATLEALIDTLSESLPEYHLPAATHNHVRHYMPQWKAGKTSLIFDAFTAVNRNDPLTVTWPNLELPNEQRALLDDLLEALGYLGRAESWVQAQRIDKPLATNCLPGSQSVDRDTGELLGEQITLLSPLPAPEYQTLRDGFLSDKKSIRKLGPTLPESLLEALSIDTADLRKRGWNRPPAAQPVTYLRPVDALKPRRKVRTATPAIATTASFVLLGTPLPRVEHSLRIGELLRLASMASAKCQLGQHDIPAMISGHNLPRNNRHRHAFYLPWDSNGDGRLDRVIVHLPDGMNSDVRRAIESLNRLWSRDGSQWQLALESIGNEPAVSPLLHQSSSWTSITPYLHPWHRKKNFTTADQIRRECRERGLPRLIALEACPVVMIKGRQRRPVHFHRFRSKHVKHQPDRLGSFWRLTFTEPAQGPLALGFACHYGLGLFRPADHTR